MRGSSRSCYAAIILNRSTMARMECARCANWLGVISPRLRVRQGMSTIPVIEQSDLLKPCYISFTAKKSEPRLPKISFEEIQECCNQ